METFSKEQLEIFNNFTQEQETFYNELEESLEEEKWEEVSQSDIERFLTEASGFTEEKVKMFHDWQEITPNSEDFNHSQLAVIKSMITDGYTLKQVSKVSNSEYSADSMKLIRFGVSLNFNDKELDELSRMDKLMTDKNIEAKIGLVNAIKNGIPEKDIVEAIEKDNAHLTILGECAEKYEGYNIMSRMSDISRIIELSKVPGISYTQIMVLTDPRFNKGQMEKIIDTIDGGITNDELLLMANPRFDESQMDEIWNAAKHGLTVEELRHVADTKFDASQMYMVYAGIRAGMLEGELYLFNPGLSYEQMGEIIHAHNDGIGTDVIETFAKPEISAEDMKGIRTLMKEAIDYDDSPYDMVNRYFKAKEEQEKSL